MNIENLKLFLEALKKPENYNKIKDKFNMEAFRSNIIGNKLIEADFENTRNCGTHGCLAGWAPLLKVKELSIKKSDRFEQFGDVCFSDYIKRVFGIKNYEDEWNWLFHNQWSDDQPSLDDAIWRLDKLISAGVPYNFTEGYGYGWHYHRYERRDFYKWETT